MPSIPDRDLRGFALSPRPVLALDLGGTQIRAAVVQPDGSRMTRVATETPSELGTAAVIDACAAALVSARDSAPREVRESLLGIGISSPGPVDPRAGAVVEPPNLGPDFRDVPLADDVEAALGLPTFLDRDTNVAALGEAAYGAGRGQHDFIYVTVSTGVGGSIVTDGRLFHGPDGMAGELGHVPVDLDGPMCGCGGRGHLEAVASGVALARDARDAVTAGTSPFLATRAAEMGLDELSARDVAEGEDAGDATCVLVMSRARRAVATACVGFVNAFNPHRIIIGGAIAEGQGERMLGLVRDTIARECFSRLGAAVRVVPPELGEDVSLAGAQPLVTSRINDPAWRRIGSAQLPSLASPGTDMSVHASGFGRA
jgi:glucokinase